MKTLTLLRHAKSDWDDPRQRDFDRPLNRRGHAAARAIGRAMLAEGMRFDAVLASPAARVVETLEGLAEACCRDLAPAFDPDLYLACPATLLDKIHETPDEATSLLVVGHNPGLEQLAKLLSGTGDETALAALAEKYPTAALAVIRLNVASWSDVAPDRGTLTRFLRPRDLDPGLGPDD
jgi:phosphohistidine phosphatase